MRKVIVANQFISDTVVGHVTRLFGDDMKNRFLERVAEAKEFASRYLPNEHENIRTRRRSLVAVAILISLISLIVTWAGVAHMTNVIHRSEAQNDAVRWVVFLKRELPNFQNILSGQTPLENDVDAIKSISNAGNLVRYRFFNHQGTTVYASHPGDIGRINLEQYFRDHLLNGKTYATINTGQGPDDRFAAVSVTYVPVMDGNKFLGAIEVQIDATTRYLELRRVAHYGLYVVMLILITLGTIMGLVVRDDIQNFEVLQAQIVQKSKLAQLGELTATVAHEIRNPLGAVKTAAFVLERKTNDKGLGLEPQFQRINNGIRRCDTIITELLDFARPKAVKTKIVAVDEWVQSIVGEERENIPKIVQMSCDLQLDDMQSAFDPDQMRRVLVNLISNASEAMVGKGKDAISNVVQEPKISVTTKLSDGHIDIVVTDNGPGITEENLVKIREPLFTTKSFGVGLGIPAVIKILENHGGGLGIQSELGQGTTMTASFPLDQIEKKVA